jgi:predicted DCC family thiol-disulfide oxidoreductase YuxK
VADTLLYDGDCGFCSSSARLAQRLAPEVHVVAYQHVALDGFGLTEQQCQDALAWVGASGTAHGADAVAHLLLAASRPWRVAGRLLLAPGVRRVAAGVYRTVAANRYRLPGGTPACRVPDHAP